MDQDKFSSLVKRVEHLEAVVFGSKIKQNQDAKQPIKIKKTDLAFSINIRTFIKKYATKKSGPKKFVLILSFLAKGEVGTNIKLIDIKSHWNKMSGRNLLGGKFNNFYSSEAKTQGWVDSKKHGTYCLTNSWKEIL